MPSTFTNDNHIILIMKQIIAPLHHFYSNHHDPFPNQINLHERYFIKKFNYSEISSALEFFSDSFSKHDQDELRNCTYAIYFKYDETGDNAPKIESIISEINRITNTLRIVRPNRVIATIFHFALKNRKRIATQITLKQNLKLTLPPYGPQEELFKRVDANKIRSYVKKVRSLYNSYGGTYQKVLNAIIFFEIGHQNHLYKPRLVNFVTCLESLFNTNPQQIGYTLRIRCSYFLENNPSLRMSLAEDIKNIYNLRSTFVHGQSTQVRILNDVVEQNRLLILAEVITRRCIQKIFDKNLISIFDDFNNLNKEMQKLEYGMPSTLS